MNRADPASPRNIDDSMLRRGFARDGDPAAFRQLAEPLLPLVFTVAARFLGDVGLAEDVTHDTLVLAMTRHDRYDAERPFRPWLLGITANLCRDRLKSAWWRRWVPLASWPATCDPSPERCSQEREEDAHVRHALSTLPTDYREAVALFYLDGMSYAEMSAITGASVPALKQRVSRGLKLLEVKVQRLYPDLAASRRERLTEVP